MNRRLLLCGCELRAYDAEARTVRVTIMTDTVARDGLRILPEGWRNREEYMRNPVVFLNHDWRSIVANTRAYEITPNGITMDARIARTAHAQEQLVPLLEDAMIHAASISWDTVRTEMRESVETVTEWDLYEWSFVTIPADPDAVIEHARAWGLDWVEEALTAREEGAPHHDAEGSVDREALLAATYAALTGARGAATGAAAQNHLREHYAALGLSYPSAECSLRRQPKDALGLAPRATEQWPNEEKRVYETRDVTARLTAAAQRLTGARDILRHWTREHYAVPETVVTALREVREAAEALLRAPAAERELQRLYAALGTTDPQTVQGLVDALVSVGNN